VIGKLLTEGLLEEIQANGALPIWRRDDTEGPFALRITKHGLKAVTDTPQFAAIARLISEVADRGAELTGYLLAFARKQPLQPRETDINGLMTEARQYERPCPYRKPYPASEQARIG
jgi:hypothetical protein